MATITLWSGVRSFSGASDYETITIEVEELATVRFSDETVVRIVRADDGKVYVNYIEREGYETRSEIFEYADINEAAKYERFVLRKAKLI